MTSPLQISPYREDAESTLSAVSSYTSFASAASRSSTPPPLFYVPIHQRREGGSPFVSALAPSSSSTSESSSPVKTSKTLPTASSGKLRHSPHEVTCCVLNLEFTAQPVYTRDELMRLMYSPLARAPKELQETLAAVPEVVERSEESNSEESQRGRQVERSPWHTANTQRLRLKRARERSQGSSTKQK